MANNLLIRKNDLWTLNGEIFFNETQQFDIECHDQNVIIGREQIVLVIKFSSYNIMTYSNGCSFK